METTPARAAYRVPGSPVAWTATPLPMRTASCTAACNSKYECAVAFEEDGQGIGLVCKKVCNQLFVGLQAKSQVSNKRGADGRRYNCWLGGALTSTRLG